MPYREMLNQFLNQFVIGRLHDLIGLPKIKVKMKDLKMTDDSETKQLMLNLKDTNNLSQTTLHEKFGIDHAIEVKRMRSEEDEQLDLNKNNSISMAIAQGLSQEILARSEARAQHALEDETHKLREEPFEQQILSENQNINLESSKLIEMLSLQMSMTPPDQQEAFYQEIAKSAPMTAALVLERFLSGGMIQPVQNQGVAPEGNGSGNNMNGNQKADQVQPSSGKQKGQTRGNPA